MAILKYDDRTGRGTGYGMPNGDNDVRELQMFLNDYGYTDPPIDEDGKFGPGTKNAVIYFQNQMGIQGDGIVGNDTRSYMQSTVTDKQGMIGELVDSYDLTTGSVDGLMEMLGDKLVVTNLDAVLDDAGFSRQTLENKFNNASIASEDKEIEFDIGTIVEDAFQDAFNPTTNDGTEEETEDLPENPPYLEPEVNEDKEKFIRDLGEVGISAVDASSLWDTMGDSWTNDPNYTLDDALIDLYDHKAFETRFPGIYELRKARDEADPADKIKFDIPTVKEYLDLEDALISGMADLGQEIGDLGVLMTEVTGAGVDAMEAQERFQQASRIIGGDVPPEVKDVYRKWYGVQGDGNLIMTFLDPEDATGVAKSWTEVQADIGAAEVAGWAEMRGELDLAQTQAERINSLGQTRNQLWDSFARIQAADNLFIEKIGEEDFTAEEEGIESEFFGDASLLSRRDQRVAEFSGGGGAMITQQGTGLGSA